MPKQRHYLIFQLFPKKFVKWKYNNNRDDGGTNPMTDFTEKVISIIKNIPEGQVMTFGQVAKLAGSPRAARQVVRILHSMSRKYQLPWHRVINSKGEIGLKDIGEQKFLLEAEGIEVSRSGWISLEEYQYSGL
jgi:methylated-DNA-protein-cysteine methyltransferase-like protein